MLYRLQLQKSARWFQEPVRPEEAPDYEELVQQVGGLTQSLASIMSMATARYNLLPCCK